MIGCAAESLKVLLKAIVEAVMFWTARAAFLLIAADRGACSTPLLTALPPLSDALGSPTIDR
jgi:hypothetical protein